MKALWRIALLAGALAAAAPATAAEVIYSFNSNVSVAKDGELTVTETVRVQAEGREIRHGIYRDFPTTFRDAGGTVREVTFSVLGVTRDGQPESYFTERKNNFIRIYAGKKDTFVSRGEHTYVFRYRTGRQIRWFDGKAELNWNVTGNFWRFPIYEATYQLNLVGSEGPVRWTAYTGRLGARGIDWRGNIGVPSALSLWQPHGASRRAKASRWLPRCPQAPSSRPARAIFCGTDYSTTATGFSAAPASWWF